jgi:plastocyanin
MRRLPLPVTALFLTVTLAATLFFVYGRATAATVSVDAGSNYFCDPQFDGGVCTTTITAGDTVVWTVVEGFHTVTECDATHTVCGNGFDSGVIESGQTFSQTFSAPGTVVYYCAIHPGDMEGEIVVQQATPSPTPEATAGPTSAGQTAAPSATPGSVPKSGGQPPSGGSFTAALLAIAGFALTVAGASAVVAVRRR